MLFGQNTSTLAEESWQANLQKFHLSEAAIQNIQHNIAQEIDKDFVPFEINGQAGYGAIKIEENGKEYVILITR